MSDWDKLTILKSCIELSADDSMQLFEVTGQYEFAACVRRSEL